MEKSESRLQFMHLLMPSTHQIAIRHQIYYIMKNVEMNQWRINESIFSEEAEVKEEAKQVHVR